MTRKANFGDPSTPNTSTTPLGSGETFTGTFEQSDFPDVMVSCKTDNTGTIYFDFSNDQSNADTFPTSGFKVASGVHAFHVAAKGPRAFRVRLVNDSGAQSYLRLYTYFGIFRHGNAPLNQTQSADSDATLVRVGSDPDIEYVSGKISGYTVIHKFGRSVDVSTSMVPISIGEVYQTPQTGSATTLRVKAGGDANDTADGTGAREVTLIGIDETGAEVTETLATAGASASSATTTTFMRLYRFYVSASGTYATQSAGSHAAAITIENGAGGTDWGSIAVDSFPRGQSEIGAYTIPSGYTGYIRNISASVDSAKTATIILFQRQNILETSAPYSAMRAVNTYGGVTGDFTIPLKSPLGPFHANTDVGFMGKLSSAGGSISVNYEILLIAD